MEGDDFLALYLSLSLVYLARVTVFVGGSALLLWYSYRHQKPGWGRRSMVAAIAAIWIVDMMSGTADFWFLCNTQGGVRVVAPVPGRPHVAIGDQIEPSLAARFLSASGAVEYELTPYLAERLGLRSGFHRFQALEGAPPICSVSGLSDSGMLASCASAVRIEAPTARYLFDASERRSGDRYTGVGPKEWSWFAEMDQAFVLDRNTGETLAAATIFIRGRVSPLSGLLRFFVRDQVCPVGATREGLPYLLIPAAFPDLAGAS